MKGAMISLLFVISMTGATAALADDNPFLGTWKINLTKSKIVGPDGERPMPLTKSVVTYERVDDMIRITDDDSFTDGHSVHMVWVGKFDGKDYPVASDPTAGSWSFRQIDSRTVILTTKKHGKVLATRRVTVSADGRTRMMTGTRTEENGAKGDVTAAYERQ